MKLVESSAWSQRQSIMAHGSFFWHNCFFHHPFSELFMGSLYGAYIVNEK